MWAEIESRSQHAGLLTKKSSAEFEVFRRKCAILRRPRPIHMMRQVSQIHSFRMYSSRSVCFSNCSCMLSQMLSQVDPGASDEKARRSIPFMKSLRSLSSRSHPFLVMCSKIAFFTASTWGDTRDSEKQQSNYDQINTAVYKNVPWKMQRRTYFSTCVRKKLSRKPLTPMH